MFWSWHPRKPFRVELCKVSRTEGPSQPRSPQRLFFQTSGCPCKGGTGKGGPGRKGQGRVGGSGWALLNCSCWGICELVDLTGSRERDRRAGVRG